MKAKLRHHLGRYEKCRAYHRAQSGLDKICETITANAYEAGPALVGVKLKGGQMRIFVNDFLKYSRGE